MAPPVEGISYKRASMEPNDNVVHSQKRGKASLFVMRLKALSHPNEVIRWFLNFRPGRVHMGNR